MVAVTVILDYYFSIFFVSFLIVSLLICSIRFTNILATAVLFLSTSFLMLVRLVRNVGADSILEAISFNPTEIVFYFNTLYLAFEIPSIKLHILMITVIGGLSVLILLLNRFFIRSNKVIYLCFMMITAIGSFNAINLLFIYKSESDELEANFAGDFKMAISESLPPNDVDIIVFIGESTSRQHMSSYGYFRETTPNIDKLLDDSNLIKYSNVISNHSHTFPSLLEALSIPSQDQERYKPGSIIKKRRHSVIDVLNAFDISTHLYSNQPMVGSWLRGNSIIFNNVDTEKLNRPSKDPARYRADKTVNEEFYDGYFLDRVLPLILNSKGVTFFHSYAGHGDYCKNIPLKSQKRVDDLLMGLDSSEIVGNLSGTLIDTLECYDSAIKYIDSNIFTLIDGIRNADTPKVLVYFSDHGESVYTGNGHDSMRYQLDMLTVPLLVYLNDSALNTFKADKVSFPEKNSLLTLDYLPYLISKLKGVDIGDHSNARHVMVRNSIRENRFIDLKSVVNEDWLTNHFVNSSNTLSRHSCLHRSNNLGKLVQGMIAFDCIEFDVVVSDDGVAYVDHDYPPDSKLQMSVIMQASKNNEKSIWIDAKNIHIPANCAVIAKNIEVTQGEILVEFPSASWDKLDDLAICFSELDKVVDYISYYVPTGELLACQTSSDIACVNLVAKLIKVRDSRFFNSFSFDINGFDFMMSIKPKFEQINYHSWGINDLKDPKLRDLNMAIFQSNTMSNQN